MADFCDSNKPTAWANGEESIAAADPRRILCVDIRTGTRLIARHKMRVRQIPGDCRTWILRSDVDRLAALAVSRTRKSPSPSEIEQRDIDRAIDNAVLADSGGGAGYLWLGGPERLSDPKSHE